MGCDGLGFRFFARYRLVYRNGKWHRCLGPKLRYEASNKTILTKRIRKDHGSLNGFYILRENGGWAAVPRSRGKELHLRKVLDTRA